MFNDPPYQLLADTVLVVHVAVVAFVVLGLVLIVLGNVRGWRWVNGRLFRLAHVGAIAIVVTQAWLGMACPLTILEMSLREKAAATTYAATTYAGSFIEHWLQRILYFDAPAWVFLAGYSLFGLCAVATFWCFPPSRNQRSPDAA